MPRTARHHNARRDCVVFAGGSSQRLPVAKPRIRSIASGFVVIEVRTIKIHQTRAHQDSVHTASPNLLDRQREYKPASLPDFALYPDLSPVQLDKLLGQG